MESFWLFIIIIWILLSVIVSKIYSYLCLNRLKKRKPLNNDDFYEKHYHTSGLSKRAVLKLREKIAEIYNIPIHYINPNDYLNKIVSIGWFTDPHIEDLSDVAIEYNAQLEQTIDLQQIATVDDFIKAFADKLKDY